MISNEKFDDSINFWNEKMSESVIVRMLSGKEKTMGQTAAMSIIDRTVTWSWLMNGRQYLTFNWVAWLIIHTDIRLRNYFVTRIYQISCNILRYFKQVKLVSKHLLNETAILTFVKLIYIVRFIHLGIFIRSLVIFISHLPIVDNVLAIPPHISR